MLLLFVTLLFAEPVDRVLAVVEDELVLASEVELERVLTAHDPDATRFFAVTRRSFEDDLIDAAVIRAVASNVALYQPDDESVQARALAVRMEIDAHGSWATFSREWGVSDEELVAWARRRLVVERYLARNLRATSDNPRDWDVELEAHILSLRARTRIRRVPEIP